MAARATWIGSCRLSGAPRPNVGWGFGKAVGTGRSCGTDGGSTSVSGAGPRLTTSAIDRLVDSRERSCSDLSSGGVGPRAGLTLSPPAGSPVVMSADGAVGSVFTKSRVSTSAGEPVDWSIAGRGIELSGLAPSTGFRSSAKAGSTAVLLRETTAGWLAAIAGRRGNGSGRITDRSAWPDSGWTTSDATARGTSTAASSASMAGVAGWRSVGGSSLALGGIVGAVPVGVSSPVSCGVAGDQSAASSD